MENKLISFICTVKNGEHTISRTIESVLEQSYNNWEMIIIDDGSKDNTKNIIEKYSILDKRIKPYVTQGMGRGNALNKAVELAEGDFITNIDADDLVHPQKSEIQLEVFKNNKDLFLVSTKGIIIFDNEKVDWEDISHEESKYHQIGEKLLIKNIINHSSVMMNKSQLLELGTYNSQRKTQLDYELWLRAFYNKKKMVILQEKLTGKRIHQNQSFENKNRLKYLANAFKLQGYYLLRLKKYHLLVVPFFNFLKGLFPAKIRIMFRNKFKK